MSRSPGATVGGQAVLEGVMMRAPTKWAVAVRRPDGVIEAISHELPRLSSRSRWARVPFVRGVLVLGESLSLGFRALGWSAQKSGEEEGVEIKRREIVFSMILALAFFIAIFMLVPLAVARGIEALVGENSVVFNVVDGVVRVALFVGYIWLISFSKEIRRVFAYHGAEHKTIHAYEAGDPLMVEAIQRYSPRHPRCGPGRWLQPRTTRQPGDDQVEVAVTSLLASLTPAEREDVDRRGPIVPAALAAAYT